MSYAAILDNAEALKLWGREGYRKGWDVELKV